MSVCLFTTRDFLTDVDQEPVFSLFTDEWRCSGDKELPVRYRPRPPSLVYYRSPSRVRKGAFRRHALLLRAPGSQLDEEVIPYLERLGFALDDSFELAAFLRRHAVERGFGPRTAREAVVVRFVRDATDLVYDDEYGLPWDQDTGRIQWERCVPQLKVPNFALQT